MICREPLKNRALVQTFQWCSTTNRQRPRAPKLLFSGDKETISNKLMYLYIIENLAAVKT